MQFRPARRRASRVRDPHRQPFAMGAVDRESIVGFEYGQDKRAANKDKLDFEEAQELWRDPDLLEIPARTIDEPRWIAIGKPGGSTGPR